MIIKKFMTDYGVEAEIWKVGYVSLDIINKYGSVTMCLYFNDNSEKYIHSVTEPILETELFDKYFNKGGDVIQNAENFMLDNCKVFINEEDSQI